MGQVPPAWRPGDLRRDGPHGAGFRGALPAGRGAGEFRQYRRRRGGGDALHRGAADPLCARPAGRDRRGRGRLPRQLRRHQRRTGGAAGGRSQPACATGRAASRGRHGDQHPRTIWGSVCDAALPSDRRSRRARRGAGRAACRARGLPDRRRPRRAALGDRGGLRHRAGQPAPARALEVEKAEPRPVQGGGDGNPLPDPEGAADRTDRRADRRAQAAFAGRCARRVGGRPAPRPRAAHAHRRSRGDDGPAVPPYELETPGLGEHETCSTAAGCRW